MKKVLIPIIVLLFAGSVFSQQVLQERGEIGLYINTTGNNEAINVKDIKGSPYYYDKYFYAFVDGDTSKPHMMRYNAYLDQMEFEKDGIQYTLEQNAYKVINFDTPINKKFIYLDYSIDKNIKKGYLIKLNKGEKYSLLKSEKIEFHPEKTESVGFGENTSFAQFKPAKPIFFIKIGEENAIEVPKSREKFAKLFVGNEKSVSEYIKKEKISLTDEKDLIMLFNFLNDQ